MVWVYVFTIGRCLSGLIVVCFVCSVADGVAK